MMTVTIGIATISDRASRGDYADESGPAIERWLTAVISSPWTAQKRVVADGIDVVEACLVDLCDTIQADLVLTSGGTGPAPRDLTPEAMSRVVEKELVGFGELMRKVSLAQVPTAILSRQTAGIRGKSLIINLPGKPAAIDLCLSAVFPAVPYCLDLIGAGRIDTHDSKIRSFRPKK